MDRIELTTNDFDQFLGNDFNYLNCGICGDVNNHGGQPHGVATGDGLTRQDIIEYIDGRGLYEHAKTGNFVVDHAIEYIETVLDQKLTYNQKLLFELYFENRLKAPSDLAEPKREVHYLRKRK